MNDTRKPRKTFCCDGTPACEGAARVYTSEYETRTSVFVLVVGKRNGKREQPVGKLLGRRFFFFYQSSRSRKIRRPWRARGPGRDTYITASPQRGGERSIRKVPAEEAVGVYGASAKAAKFLPRGGPPIDNHHASHLGESPLSGTDTTHIHTLPTHAGSPGLAVSGENLRKTGVTTDRRAR